MLLNAVGFCQLSSRNVLENAEHSNGLTLMGLHFAGNSYPNGATFSGKHREFEVIGRTGFNTLLNCIL